MSDPLSSRVSESNARNLLFAYEAGEIAAEELTLGAPFDGAGPSAVRQHLVPDTGAYRMFIHGYSAVLDRRWPKGVPVDANGNITR